MKLILVSVSAILALLVQTGFAKTPTSDVRLVATSSVKVSKEDTDALKQAITEYAFQHNYSKPEGWTLPRNRKLMLPPGGFSTTYRGQGDYYLVAHSVMGKDCVAINMYAEHSDPLYKKLLEEIGQSLQQAMPGKLKTFTNDRCGAK